MQFEVLNAVAATVGLGRDVTQAIIDWAQRARVRKIDNSDAQTHLGLKLVFDAPEADVDICFVHGLRGNSESTWTQPDGAVFWPRDLLAKDQTIGCSMRMFSYGYNTKFPTSEYLTTRTLYHQAGELVEALCRVRSNSSTQQRAIIFVGHELGGIVIQSAFILSSTSADERLRSVCLSTTGIIFLGTPFRGLQDDEWLNSFLEIVKSSVAVREADISGLEYDSKKLRNMLQPFIAASNEVPIYGFQPTSSDYTHSPRIERYTVKTLSKTLADMGRFASRTDPGYKKVAAVIAKLCQDSFEIKDASWRKYNESHQVIVSVPTFSNAFLRIKPDLPVRNPDFLGRTLELDQLEKLLSKDMNDGIGSMLVVNGPAGIGKTQLVLEYAHTHQTDFTAIFWIFAESVRSIELGFFSIAQKLLHHYAHEMESSGLSSSDARTQAAAVLGLYELLQDTPHDTVCLDISVTKMIAKAVLEWFYRKENNQWLLILDAVNMVDPTEIFLMIPINRFNHGRIILTRRRALELNTVRQMRVSAFSSESSRSLLAKVTGKHMDGNYSKNSAKRIVESCSGNPLKLVEVATKISSTGMEIGDFCKVFLNAEGITSIQQNRPRHIPSFPASLNGIWQHQLQQLSKQERRLLNCCCVFPGKPIPWEIFSKRPDVFGVTHVDELGFAAEQLESRKLVTCSQGYGYILANDLVATWHLDRLDQNEKAAAVKRTWQCIASFARETSMKADSDILSTLAQKDAATLVSDLTITMPEEFSRFHLSLQNLVDLAEICCQSGHYRAAEQLGNCAYKMLQDGDISKKASIRLLGMYLELKATTEAANVWSMIERSRKGSSRKYVREDDAQCLLRIRLQHQSGNIDEAIDLARHSITQLENNRGPVEFLTLSTLKVLASFLLEQGSYEMADPIMLRLLVSYEVVYGPNHPLTIDALELLGLIFLAEGKIDDAERSFSRAAEQIEQRLGSDHPSTQICRTKLAAVYHRQGRYKESLEMYSDALTRMEGWFRPQHPDVIKIRINRAQVYMASGDLENAAKDHEDVVKAYDSKDKSTTMLLNVLDIQIQTIAKKRRQVLISTGKLADAEEVAERYYIEAGTL